MRGLVTVMPQSMFGAGASPILVLLDSARRFILILPVGFLVFSVFIATPVRIKLNRYPRLLQALVFLAPIALYLYSVHGFYSGEMAKVRAQEQFIASHPTKVLKREVQGTIVDERLEEEQPLGSYILIRQGKERKFLAVSIDQWAVLVPGDRVTVIYKRRQNPYVRNQNDKNWSLSSVTRDFAAGEPRHRYFDGGRTRESTATVVKAYSLPSDKRLYRLCLELADKTRRVAWVHHDQWLRVSTGDRVVLVCTQQKDGTWKQSSIREEVK